MSSNRSSDFRRNHQDSSGHRHRPERRNSLEMSRSRDSHSVRDERSPRRYHHGSQRGRYSKSRDEHQKKDQRRRSPNRSQDKHSDDRRDGQRKKSRSRSRSKSGSRSRSISNSRDTSRQKSQNQASSQPEKKFREIFELLKDFRKDFVSYMKSVFTQDVRPEEIFTRWYINSLTQGANNYFMPISFKALENDIEYYKKCLDSKVTPKDVISKVQEIWDQYSSQKYYIKPADNTLRISKAQHQRLKELYSGPPEEFESNKRMLLSAYEFMGTLTNHLSVPPSIIKNKDSSMIELFGSPLNTSQSYCSPFEIEKKYFGSLGSFFEYEIQPGINIANPPFDESLMEQMADRLEKQLEKTADVTVVCIVPVWDPSSQIKYGLKNYEKDFVAYEKLIKSRFFKEQAYLPKFDYKFWDYFFQKHVPVSNCHMIVLSNHEEMPIKAEEILAKWKEISPNETKFIKRAY